MPIVLSNVECDGNESSIISCADNTSDIQCDSGEGAAIICQGIYGHVHKYSHICVYFNKDSVLHPLLFSDLDNTVQVSCEDGDIRLVDGSNPLEGRVEVCINNAWGTVCENSFSTSDAHVVCTQLGYRFNGTQVLYISEFSQGSGPIFLDKVACDGEEERIIECGGTAPGVHTCTHNQDVAIRCIGKECQIVK